MRIHFSQHALDQMEARQVLPDHVRQTIEAPESSRPGHGGAIRCERVFAREHEREGKRYRYQKVEARIVMRGDDVLVVTVISKSF
jgi:hypothetical protein